VLCLYNHTPTKDPEGPCPSTPFFSAAVLLSHKKKYKKGGLSPQDMRSRRFVFTWNNYPIEYNDNDSLDTWLNGLGSKYCIAGREISPTTGTPHLQGYVEFTNARTLTAVLSLLPGCHVEPAKGTPTQCREYSIKDNQFRECGTPPKDPGTREKQRWEHARTLASEGRFTEIPADIYIRYIGNLERIYRSNLPTLEPLATTAGLWIMGPSGTGKSRGVRERYPTLYPKPLNKWWDGYKDNKEVLIDDVDPSHQAWIGSFLKIWADHYPFIAEKKGGSCMIRPERIIVTSQYSIETIFTEPELQAALLRRFTVVPIEQF